MKSILGGVLVAGTVMVSGLAAGGTEDWKELVEVHGFTEFRGGTRLQDDPYEKDMSIMEARLQLDVSAYPEWGRIVVRGDGYGDGVLEEGEFDLREASVLTSPVDFMDVKVGRQILTWGTGDLVFINDLFPKDWQSFFIGRDTEYLKAPSDAVKVSLFSDPVDVDIVYTPQFDADRNITGERLSYWNSTLGRTAGRDVIVTAYKPDRWFQDDEWAVRVYRNIRGVEMAVYGYWGYWKSPFYPDLNVYGASMRGSVGKGIGNMEVGFYDSREDRRGTNNTINNSEIRYLVGYTQEVARDFTAAMQYYVEQMLDYDAYKTSFTAAQGLRDEFRHLLTLRLTRLLMNQNLRLSLFTYYSPSDQDVYMRPNIHYKANDNVAVEFGANIFKGDQPYTFFSQFKYNTNMYGAVRYSF
jgi:hypothetical protein